jgi:hypothetical protein
MFFNENANKPNEWRYVRSTRQAILHQDQQIFQSRFTYQANQKNKFGMTFDQEAYCGCPFGTTATVQPDGSTTARFPTQRFVTADWTSRSRTGCCSKRAASTASSAGAACTCRPARATTSTPSHRA